MYRTIKEEIIRDLKGSAAVIGILIVISLPGWATFAILYFINAICRALFGVEVGG
jgi:hypothetical protein